MADNTMLIGEVKTLAQLISDDFSETHGVFEDSTITKMRQNMFIGIKGILRLKLPSVTITNPAYSIQSLQYVQDVDLGGGSSGGNGFGIGFCADCYMLRDLVIRKNDDLIKRNNGSLGNCPISTKPEIANIYVPRALVSTYQNDSTWASIYAKNSNLFKPLEDYTVDGTITGEMNWSLVDTLPTPVYSLSERTFDGASDYIDTGVQLFNTVNPEFTVLCDFEWPQQSAATNGVFYCGAANSDLEGFRFFRDGSGVNMYMNYKTFGSKVQHSEQLSSSAYDNRYKVAWIIKDGFSTLLRFENDQRKDIKYKVMSDPTATSTATLIIGRNWDSTPRYYKGTIHNFKVYNKALNGRQIRTVLGIV